MNATEEYIAALGRLKNGELGLLRLHAGKGLDESLHGYDLFTGIWWTLRQRSPRAPRRSVAWLVAKLYAFKPIEHSPGDTLAGQLAQCIPREERERERFQQKCDELLLLSLDKIEFAMQWALHVIASNERKLDWVLLTDDLSIWERESTRLKWAEEFIQIKEEIKC